MQILQHQLHLQILEGLKIYYHHEVMLQLLILLVSKIVLKSKMTVYY